MASSGALSVSSPFFRLAFLAQVAFYLLAIAGWAAEKVPVRLRVLSVPHAFVLLNVAAAASLFAFLRGTQTASWRAALTPRGAD